MNRHVVCERCGKTVGRRVVIYIRGLHGIRPNKTYPAWWGEENGDRWSYCHDCAQTTKALEALRK